MKKIIIGIISLLIIAVGIFLYAASGSLSKDLEAPKGTPVVKTVPDDWNTFKDAKMAARDKHIADYATAYDRFANFGESDTDGIPYIVLKLLPVVAPEFWGQGDDFLSVMGLFQDERNAASPVPRGMGFSGLSRADINGNIDYASFGCGACHIGRVRLDDNRYYYLDGGINSQFNVVGYRKRVNQSIDKLAGSETDIQKRIAIVKQKFLASLEQVHAQDPNYFYKNYSHEGRNFDAAYEQTQIDLFKKTIDPVISQFYTHHVNEYEGWKKFVSKYYKGGEQLLLDGLPGTEDAIGFNTVKANANLKSAWYTRPFAFLTEPPSHGLTDIMVVWEQNQNNVMWDEQKKNLVNGNGQWNGHIPLPIYKNIAAQLTIGFENVDVSVSAFAEEILEKMPASVYPFNVDVALAKKGQALFAENCAACHQPHNGKVYRNIGTDMGRANIADTFITLGAISGFTGVCGPNTTVMMYGKEVKPCAQYQGVSLEGKAALAMTPPKLHNGYNALPLVGIWAQAPYLHNGTVPTLYHLLVPNERPKTFVKSRLDYDKKLLGFAWDTAQPITNNEGYLVDTTLTAALSNKGHDKNIEQDGKTFKLDWSDNKEGALAIMEYLKTL